MQLALKKDAFQRRNRKKVAVHRFLVISLKKRR